MKEGIRLLKLAWGVVRGRAGDGLEQASRIWKAFLLRNLSYTVTFINLILIWAEELFFFILEYTFHQESNLELDNLISS